MSEFLQEKQKLKDVDLDELLNKLQILVRDEIANTPKTYLEGAMREVAKEVFTEIIEKEHSGFYVPPEKHYLDHKAFDSCSVNRDEWKENHEFVSGMRKNGTRALWASITFMIIAVTGGAIMVIKLGIKAFFKISVIGS